MSSAVAERATAIRQHRHLRDHPDRSLVRRYSFLAARWEELRLWQHVGKTTPDDDHRLGEVTRMLQVLTRELGLSDDNIIDRDGYLIGDPQRLLTGTWLEDARMWFSG